MALSTLSVARLSLEDLLTRVASFAVRAIPGAGGAGLTLKEHKQPDTVVTSDAFVRQVEGIQYGINEGPCIAAAATGKTVRSGSLSADPRWPRFGPRVGQLGVHSRTRRCWRRPRRLTANLERAMVNRSVIDQAIGIIISRTGITPDEAFKRIRIRR